MYQRDTAVLSGRKTPGLGIRALVHITSCLKPSLVTRVCSI